MCTRVGTRMHRTPARMCAGTCSTCGAQAIYWQTDEQKIAAEGSREMFQEVLVGAGLGEITTEIAAAGPFFYAEPYHQQYLSANPNGYCGLGGTGLSCPIGVAALSASQRTCTRPPAVCTPAHDNSISLRCTRFNFDSPIG